MPSPTPEARRPRPGLTTKRVTDAGRRIIQRDGLSALSMRAVAVELDTAAGSLYRHVPDRGALLQAILEDVAADLPVDVAGETPALRLRNRFVTFHDYMAEHVWVLHVLVGGSRVARNAFGFTEACLADFQEAGLDLVTAGQAFRTCYQLTLGELLDLHPLEELERPTPREQLVAAADAASLPHFVALRELGPRAGGENFPRSIEILIAGLLAAG